MRWIWRASGSGQQSNTTNQIMTTRHSRQAAPEIQAQHTNQFIKLNKDSQTWHSFFTHDTHNTIRSTKPLFQRLAHRNHTATFRSPSQTSRRVTRMPADSTGSISLSCRLVSKYESDLYLRHTLLNPQKHGHQTVNNTITMQDSTQFPGIACDTGLLINRKVSSELVSNWLWNQLSTCIKMHHRHIVEHDDDTLRSLANAKLRSGLLHN